MSCTGGYEKIAEPPDYMDKRKVSKGRTEFEGQQLEVPTQPTRKSEQRAYIEEGSKDKSDVLKLNTMDKFYPIAREVNEHLASRSQSSDDKLDNSHSYKADEQAAEEATQVHRAPATAGPSTIHAWRRKRKSTCVASKRSQKYENNYTVIINWMKWYANEDDEENIKPLHNKRTEQRTKQRLLKNPTDVNTELQATDDPYCTKNDGEFDMGLINSGKDKSCNSVEGSPQELLSDRNYKNDHIGKSLHACDDPMQRDTYQTSQGCVVRSPFHISRTLSADVDDGCGKAVTLDDERDDVVDLIDLD